VCVLGNREFVDHMIEVAGPQVPVLKSPEMASKALAALWWYERWGRKRRDNMEYKEVTETIILSKNS
jgi:acyl-CoA synthetase (NDP forming)